MPVIVFKSPVWSSLLTLRVMDQDQDWSMITIKGQKTRLDHLRLLQQGGSRKKLSICTKSKFSITPTKELTNGYENIILNKEINLLQSLSLLSLNIPVVAEFCLIHYELQVSIFLLLSNAYCWIIECKLLISDSSV